MAIHTQRSLWRYFLSDGYAVLVRLMSKMMYVVGSLLLVLFLYGCTETTPPKIGISFGVGEASRWPKEMEYMLERAKMRGMGVEVRFNKTDKPKTQTQDCFELINSGISVLVLIPRDVRRADEILNYAKRKQVKVLSYGRAVMGESVDLFIGYDCYKIGQNLGQHLTEKVYKGDIIVLKGDKNDFNTPLLYYGGMKYIQPLVESGKLRVLLDDYVPGWSVQAAKEMVKKAVSANNNTIDAIFASNDKLAEASWEALQELGITDKVIITGMDAELSAVKRLVEGSQDATVFMDLKALAYTAIDEAYNMATKNKVMINSEFDNESAAKIDAYLINGKIITKENIDKILIQPGHFAREAVYGGE